jgi:hypothetical protein
MMSECSEEKGETRMENIWKKILDLIREGNHEQLQQQLLLIQLFMHHPLRDPHTNRTSTGLLLCLRYESAAVCTWLLCPDGLYKKGFYFDLNLISDSDKRGVVEMAAANSNPGTLAVVLQMNAEYLASGLAKKAQSLLLGSSDDPKDSAYHILTRFPSHACTHAISHANEQCDDDAATEATKAEYIQMMLITMATLGCDDALDTLLEYPKMAEAMKTHNLAMLHAATKGDNACCVDFIVSQFYTSYDDMQRQYQVFYRKPPEFFLYKHGSFLYTAIDEQNCRVMLLFLGQTVKQGMGYYTQDLKCMAEVAIATNNVTVLELILDKIVAYDLADDLPTLIKDLYACALRKEDVATALLLAVKFHAPTYVHRGIFSSRKSDTPPLVESQEPIDEDYIIDQIGEMQIGCYRYDDQCGY